MRRRVYAGLFVATLAATACGDDAAEERREVEAAGDQVGEKLEDAAGELGEAAQKAGEELEEAANDLTGRDSLQAEDSVGQRRDTLAP